MGQERKEQEHAPQGQAVIKFDDFPLASNPQYQYADGYNLGVVWLDMSGPPLVILPDPKVATVDHLRFIKLMMHARIYLCEHYNSRLFATVVTVRQPGGDDPQRDGALFASVVPCIEAVIHTWALDCIHDMIKDGDRMVKSETALALMAWANKAVTSPMAAFMIACEVGLGRRYGVINTQPSVITPASSSMSIEQQAQEQQLPPPLPSPLEDIARIIQSLPGHSLAQLVRSATDLIRTIGVPVRIWIEDDAWNWKEIEEGSTGKQ